MTTYSVKRTIQAEPDAIWALLTDSSSYASWNPSVIGIEGTIGPGEKIKLTSAVNPNRSMVWADGMPFGLFKGVRTYTLTPTGGATEFSMEEVFSGLLEPLISKSIPDMSESFEQFADGLKSAAEAT